MFSYTPTFIVGPKYLIFGLVFRCERNNFHLIRRANKDLSQDVHSENVLSTAVGLRDYLRVS